MWYKLKRLEQCWHVLEVKETYGSKRCLKKNVFSQLAFNADDDCFIATDVKGNLYYVESLDDDPCFKVLGNIGPVTFLAFNPLDKCEIIAGLICTDIRIFQAGLNIKNSYLLSGHKAPPTHVSFYKNYCLTCSNREVFIWCLKSWTKICQLRIDKHHLAIKNAKFSNTGLIVVVYNNSIVHAWRLKYLNKPLKMDAKRYGLQIIKDFDFTKDGKAMILIGVHSKLLIFDTSNWNVLKSVKMPEGFSGITVHVLPMPLDGGANKIFVVLSSDNILKCLDLDSSCFIESHKLLTGVRKVVVSHTGKYIAYISENEVLNLMHIKVLLNERTASVKKQTQIYKPSLHTHLHHIQCIRKNIKAELNLNRLKSILEVYGAYPDRYRMMIWSTILDLPCNRDAYIALTNRAATESYALNILQDCTLADRSKTSLLTITINCLVQWCPLLALCPYLPKFVFPFIIVCQKNLLIGFELLLNVLLNFCQKWFEYHPLPPVNILGIIENILSETDPQLLKVFCERGVTSTQYAWPLLQTTMSEVLSAQEWLILWDHIISSSETSFLLFCIIAYSICSREIIISSLHSADDFTNFYSIQSNTRARDVVNIAKKLSKKVSHRFHPSRYFRKEWKKLPANGPYQCFLLSEYPKILIEKFYSLCTSKLNSTKKSICHRHLKTMEHVEKERLDKEVKDFLSHIQQARIDAVHKCVDQQVQNEDLMKDNTVRYQNCKECCKVRNLSPSTSNTDNYMAKISQLSEAKYNGFTDNNFEQLEKDTVQLEREVQTFLQYIRSLS